MTHFVVVEFLQFNEVEVVPDFWVDNNKVPWSKTASIYAKKAKSPKDGWLQYDVSVRYKNNLFATYEEALKKCKKLLDYTDSCLEDSEDDRRRRKNVRDTSFYYDSDISTEGSNLLPEPPIPKFDELQEEKSDELQKEKSDELLEAVPIEIIDIKETCMCNTVYVEKMKGKLQEISEDLKQLTKTFEAFVIKSKREWEELRIICMGNGTENRQKKFDAEAMSVLTSMLPISSEDDLKIFEEEILGTAKYSDIFNHIVTKLGGKNGRRHLLNTINYCFDLEFQRNLNWSGANKKIRLNDKKIILQILEVVTQCHAEITQHDAIQHLKYLFQHTFDRLKGEERKKKK